MVLFNYSTKELTAKIVYYGPGLCGKTTNLQYIHANLPGNIKGKMLSLATKTDRTLFFDFLPLDLGMIRGMKTRVQLYTVPGQVFYNETRKLVLKGADGIVFVADSQETMAGANVEAFKNLEENLRAHGLTLSEMPHVIQFNKRDLPRLSGIEEMNSAINRFNAPFYESVATSGIGVQDTLKAITKLVLLNLTQKYDPRSVKAASAQPKAPIANTPPPASPVMDFPEATEASIPPPAVGQDSPGLALAAAERGIKLPDPGLPLSTPEPPAEEAALPPSLTLPEPPDFSVGPAPASERASFMDAERESAPDFADSDIDDLVGEVGEREFTEAPLPVEEPSQAAPVFEQEAAEPVAEETDRIELEMEPEEFAQDVPVDMPSSTLDEPEPAIPSGSDFVVDRNFDPDWQAASPEPSPVDPPQQHEPFDLPADSFEPNPETESVAAQTEFELSGEKSDTVRLTDVVPDETLSAGPDLNIIRLAAGGVTEIVLPVELGTGADRKRFKLALNLRLDHVD